MGNGFYTRGQPTALERNLLSGRFRRPRRRWTLLPLLLFALTIASTLAVGAQLTQAYRQDDPPYSEDFFLLETISRAVSDASVLFPGWPFALTLMGILLAHELGHYFACRHYGIEASLPYFIPAPTLIGTMGAFIRIRSPIVHRRALFDVGIAGPLVGFTVALPALIVGIALSKSVPGVWQESPIVFGNPPLVQLLARVLRPDVPLGNLVLHPVGFAAWVGLFATALNLLPVGQLDGGHAVYALSPARHRLLSRLLIVVLLIAGVVGIIYPQRIWPGWLVWAGILGLFIRTRHPAVLEASQKLDRKRLWIAVLGLLIFLLSFTPIPFHLPT